MGHNNQTIFTNYKIFNKNNKKQNQRDFFERGFGVEAVAGEGKSR
jgi:hypothetical protein